MFQINPDNRVLQALSKYFDIVWLTILWIVTSLPVVTLGVSTTALSGVMMALASDTAESGVARAFFTAWRREWRQGLWVGCVLLLLTALVAADILVCLSAPPAGVFGALLWLGTILFGLCVICAAVYACPVLAKFHVEPRQLLHNLFILPIQHPVHTAKLFVLWAAALLLIYRLGFMGPLFSGPLLYVAAKVYTRVFQSYIARLPSISKGNAA